MSGFYCTKSLGCRADACCGGWILYCGCSDAVTLQYSRLFYRERICDWRRRFPSRRSGSVSGMRMVDGRRLSADLDLFSTRSAQQRQASLSLSSASSAPPSALTVNRPRPNGLARIHTISLHRFFFLVFATGTHCTLDPCKTSPNSNQERKLQSQHSEKPSLAFLTLPIYLRRGIRSLLGLKLEHGLQSSSSHRQLTDYTLTTTASNFAHSYTQH